MVFTHQEIRSLRQRLGWSQAEMARQMGCSAQLIQQWESGQAPPDMEALNQLNYLHNHVEALSRRVSENPGVEREMESRRVGQFTHRDLLKDN